MTRYGHSWTIPVVLAALLPIAASSGPEAGGGDAAAAHASPPDCRAPEHRQFDFWVGRWWVHNRQADPGTPEDPTLHDTGTARAHVHPILDGCAIVEHWEGRLVPDRHVLGFSLRAFDPRSERWHVLLNWPPPGAPGFFEIDGRFADEVGDFVFPGRGGWIRYRFSGTRSGEPRWEGARAEDRNGQWTPFWTMRFEPRVESPDSILDHGRSRTDGHCSEEAFRAFDFVLGEWAGKEAVVEEGRRRTRPIRLHSLSILEGCAVVELLDAGGDGRETTKRFLVRSFVPAEDRWVQYSLDRGDVRLVRWEGEGTGGGQAVDVAPVRLLEQRLDGGASVTRRMTWRRDGDRLIREIEVSDDGGETWSLHSRAELERE